MGALVGRDREMAAVRRFVAGAGGALMVVGEAGIGKSRLLAEAAAVARSANRVVLTGRAVPGGGTYRALTEALLGHFRDPRVVDADDLRPFRAALGRIVAGWDGADAGGAGAGGADPLVVLGEGLLRMLTTAGRGCGCLLVLDDLHWADPDTVALVEYLAGAAGAAGVLLAVAARDDQPGLSPGSGPYEGAERLVGQPGVTTLRLNRLDDDAVAALAGHHAEGRPIPGDVLNTVLARAAGLPLLVEELLASAGDGADPVPATMTVLVARRLAALDGPSSRIVQAAAVLGAEPDWDLVAPIAGQEEAAAVAALRAATDVGLLMPAGGRLRWRHMLVRDAVLATLLPPEHAVLARRAADRLDERGGPGDDALAADLLTAAGETSRAAGIWLRLARRDTARGAVRTAQELVERAVALGVAPARVAMDRVRLLCLRGQVPDAMETGAAALADLTGDEHAELCLELARAAVLGGRWDQAQHYVERAGRTVDPRSAVLAAEASFGAGEIRRATALASAAVDAAERAGGPDALCAALVVVGRCASLSTPAEAAAAFARAAQCAAENGLVPRRVEALFGLGLIELSDRGDPEQLTRARELALQAGLLAPALSMDVVLTDHRMTVDGPVAVEPAARRTAERAARLRLSGLQALSETFAAAARAVAGDIRGMDALLDGASARADASLEVAAVADAVRALPHLMARDLPRATALLDRGMARLIGHEPAAPLVFWGLWALLRTLVADRDEQARALVRGAHAGLRDTNRAALAYAEAVVAGRAGRGGEAAHLLATADGMLDGRPWWRRLLRLLVLEAAVRDGWGEPVPALRADLAAFERDGEAAFARTCRDLLRQAGVPTRRGRGTTPVPPALRALGVTSREMDVLVLVAGGLTNAEVGGRLYLSPRTVESHVANLLTKTGSSSRGDLRAFAP